MFNKYTKITAFALALLGLCVSGYSQSKHGNKPSSKDEGKIEQGAPMPQIVSYRYIPVEPMPIPAGLRTAAGSTIDLTKPLESLHNELLMMSIAQRDASGSLSYFTGSGSVEMTSGLFTFDSVRYTVVPWILPATKVGLDSSGNIVEIKRKNRVVFLIVGVGARGNVDFYSLKGSIDTGQVFNVGAKASEGTVRGSINIRALGVTSATISPLLRTSPSLTFENISEMFRSLDLIKLIGVLGVDNKAQINPQIIAIDPGDNPVQEIFADLYAYLGNEKVREARAKEVSLQ